MFPGRLSQTWLSRLLAISMTLIPLLARAADEPADALIALHDQLWSAAQEAVERKDVERAVELAREAFVEYDRSIGHAADLEAPEFAAWHAKMAAASSELGSALRRLAYYQEALPFLQRSEQAYLAMSRSVRAAELLEEQGDCHDCLKDNESAAKVYQQCIERFKALKDDRGLARNSLNLGKALHRLKRYDEALPCFQEAEAAYSTIGDRLNAAWMLDWQGACYRDLKNDEEAVKIYRQCIVRFNDLMHQRGLAENARSLGKALYRLKRYDEAAPCFQQAETAFTAIENQVEAAWMIGWQGDCHRELKDDEAAVKAYRRCVPSFRELRHDKGVSINSSDLGKALYRLKRYDEALSNFQQAEAAYTTIGDRLNAAWILDWQGACYRDLKNDEEAVKIYGQCVERFKDLMHQQGLAENARSLGQALYRLKKYDEAVPCFQQAETAFTNIANQVDAAWMFGWQGDCLNELQRFQEAELAYREQLNRFELMPEIGLEHVNTASSLENLALLYKSQENFTAAEPLYQRTLKIREKKLGIDHLDTAISLDNLAGLYISQRIYTAAEPLYQRSLKIRERTLGLDHLDTATSLDNLAGLYTSRVNYVAAEPLYQRSLKIREKTLGLDHLDTSRSLHNLVAIHSFLGNYATAVPLCEKALRIREKTLGPDHPDTATSLASLAVLYAFQGNYAAAEPLCQKALKIRENTRGPDHPDTATSLDDLASLYTAQGNYAAVEPLYQRALTIREKTHGPDHPDTATSLNNLAELYSSQGNYAAAEPLYQRALKIREKTFGLDHPTIATSLNSLADLFDRNWNYTAAEPLYQRALKIREKLLGPDHPDTATSLTNLAGLYRWQGNYVAAEPLYQRALKIRLKTFGPDHPETAACLTSLAGLYKSQENYTLAELLHQRALQIFEKSLGPDHPATAGSLQSLARLYMSQANFTAAEPLYQRALRITEKNLGPDHQNIAPSLIGLAEISLLQGNQAAAEFPLRRALNINEKAFGLDHPGTSGILSRLAMLEWFRGQSDSAAPLAERGLDISFQHLDATAAIQTEQQQFLMSREIAFYVDVWLTVAGTDARWTSGAYRDVLAWKGAITARQQGLRMALKDDPLFTKFQRATQQLSTVALGPPMPPSDPKFLAAWKAREPELRRAWETQKNTLEAEHERLEQELAVKSVRFRESLQRRRVRPNDLIAALKAQTQPTALVDLLEYRYMPPWGKGETAESRIAAFVVRGDQPVVRVELGSATAIAEQVSLWRANFGRKDESHDPGAELRTRVWLPLEAHLNGIETVLISPDGVLAQLPWGALPGEKPGKYLIEERAMTVIPVSQMLPELLRKERRSEPPESLLLTGDIQYGGDPGQPQDLLVTRDAVGRVRDGRLLQFGQLAQANAELASIERRYRKLVRTGKSTTLDLGEATEVAFREQAPQHQWLHIITHGFFAPAELTAEARRSVPPGLDPQSPTAPPSPPVMAGIGAVLKLEEGRCLITELVTAGAAQKDGRLQVGDEILSVANPDSAPVTFVDKSLEEFVAIIRGPVGTNVHLQVRPLADPKQTVEIVITRAPLPSQTVNTKPAPIHPGLLSGLAFAGANTPPEPGKDDGILTALEVEAMNLNQVDAVVLSACETGLGEVAGGEGLLGLQRAFQVAGAKTVVASLWKVPDAATARLMQRFYENLWDRKMGKLAALREAQIWMLHDQGARGLINLDKDTPKDQPLPPYYWAAFVLSGDWR